MTGGKLGAAQVAVVVALLLAVGTVVVTTAGGKASPSGVEAAPSVADQHRAQFQPEPAQVDPPARNNSTVHHRNPSKISSESDASAVPRWLVGGVGSDLAGDVNLSESESERARRFLRNNSEYARLAEQYSSNDSGAGSGGPNDELRTVVRIHQQQFLAAVQRFRQVHDRYRRAIEANRTLRARRLAHVLERRIVAVNRSARLLNRSYENLSSTGRDELRTVVRTVHDIRANVTQTQLIVRDRTLIRTRLSVGVNGSTASFTDPVRFAGQLQTADGKPVANETVSLRIGNRTRNVTTDERGRFEAIYRPTLTETGTSRRTVTFTPANTSVYLRSSATVRFAVKQVVPNVTVTNLSSAVSYNEPFDVGGDVEAGGVGVPDVPLVVTVGGIPVEHVRTGPNGSFAATARLPANVSTGNARVRVRLPVRNDTFRGELRVRPLTGRALGLVNASSQVTVKSTPTRLSITEVRPFDRSALVTGRLRTADGEPIPNRTVELRVGNGTVTTVTTNATGAFATTVRIPESGSNDSSIRIMAAFLAPGNLESAQANTTAELSSTETTLLRKHVGLGAVGALAVAAVGIIVWQLRSSNERMDRTSDALDPRAGEPGTPDRSPEELLDAATSALDDGEFDAAAVAAYASVRERLREAGFADRPLTHWEFCDACRGAGLPADRLAELEELTETYERAAFAAESVSADDAAAAVEVARSSDADRADGRALGPDCEASSAASVSEDSAP